MLDEYGQSVKQQAVHLHMSTLSFLVTSVDIVAENTFVDAKGVFGCREYAF